MLVQLADSNPGPPLSEPGELSTELYKHCYYIREVSQGLGPLAGRMPLSRR